MKKPLLTTAALTAVIFAAPAKADDNDKIAAQLKAMQEQMESMQREMTKLKKQLAESKAKDSSLRAEGAAIKKTQKLAKDEAPRDVSNTTPQESPVKISMTPAPKFETADGAYSFKLGGFVQVDGGIVNDDVRDRPDGTTIRRARLNVSGTVARDFKYKFENDFAGNTSAITDAYLEYIGFKPFTFTVGNFKEPFSLETLTSDLHTTFIERTSITAFSPDRRIGVMASTGGEVYSKGFWTASLGGFGDKVDTTASTDDESRDITGRLTFAPLAEKDKVIHFGVAGSYRIPSGADTFSFSSRSENQLSSASADLAVNTGTISNVDNVQLLGLETAGVYGPASIQGEYMRAAVKRRSGAEPIFSGYSIEASYFLTGENRNYLPSAGKFDRVKPKNAVTSGGIGAWQLASRYSNLDLNDAGINGGKMSNTSFAIKWIPNDYTMLTLNYIMSNTDSRAVTPNDDPNILLLRTQFDF